MSATATFVLRFVELVGGHGVIDVVGRRRCTGATGESGEEVVLDPKHPRRCQGSDVIGGVVAVEQAGASCHGAGRQVFGELAARCGGGDDARAGDDCLGLPADVGVVPAGASGAEPGDDQFGGGVAVELPDAEPGGGGDRGGGRGSRGVQFVDPADRGCAVVGSPCRGGRRPSAPVSRRRRGPVPRGGRAARRFVAVMLRAICAARC